MSKNELDEINRLLTRIERIWKIALACLLTIISGAVWASRIQFEVNDLTSWKAGADAKLDLHGHTIERIKGRLGVASLNGDVLANSTDVVWTGDLINTCPEQEEKKKEEPELETH